MSRRQDAATATVGAGLTATGGYLRHAGVQEYIEHHKKEPRWHGPAIARRGNPLSRKLYGAGALVGVLGAPALAIGGTKFVRGDRTKPTPLAKRDPNKPSFLEEGLKGTGEALVERKDTAMQPNVPFKARAAGAGTSVGAGALGALAARGLLRHKGGGTKALITPVAGVLTGAAATPLSSRVVHHVSPGYEVTASGVKRKKRGLKRASSASYQHRDTPRSFQADISKASWKNFFPAPPGVKKIPRGKLSYEVDDNFRRGATTARVFGPRGNKIGSMTHYSSDSGWLNPADEMDLRRARNGPKEIGSIGVHPGYRRRGVASNMLASEQKRKGELIHHSSNRSHDGEAWAQASGKMLGGKVPKNTGKGSYSKRPTAKFRGMRISEKASTSPYGVTLQRKPGRVKVQKDASTRKYRAKVMAAGAVPVPGVNWVAQTKTAGALAPTGKKRRAEATQFTGSATGDVAGFLGGAHGAAYLARHNKKFQDNAELANAGLESVKARLPKLPKPKINMPAGASSGRAGKVVRAAVRPLKNPKTAAAAAVGGFGGQMVLGNALQQAAMTRNIHQGRVKKVASAPGMTRREQEKQLKRKSRLIAINTMGATTGAAGLAAYGASKHPGLIAHKPQLEGLTLGLGALGGGIGSYAGFKRAKVEHRDLKAQRKALGVAKAFQPLRAPSGHPIMRANKMLRADDTAWTRSRKKQVLGGKYRPDDLMQAPPNWYYGRVHHLADIRQGVSKGMPDQSELATPAGLLKAKTYTSSSYRRKPSTGQLVRVKAGLR